MLQSLKAPWHLMRIVRLVLGITAIASAFLYHNGFLGIAGGYLTLISVLNIGCCAGEGCNLPKTGSTTRLGKSNAEPAEYNEVL